MNTVERKRKKLTIITVEDKYTFYMYSPPFEEGAPDNSLSDVVFNDYGYVGDYWGFVGMVGLEETFLEQYLIKRRKTKEEAKEIAEEINGKILGLIPPRK